MPVVRGILKIIWWKPAVEEWGRGELGNRQFGSQILKSHIIVTPQTFTVPLCVVVNKTQILGEKYKEQEVIILVSQYAFNLPIMLICC